MLVQREMADSDSKISYCSGSSETPSAGILSRGMSSFLQRFARRPASVKQSKIAFHRRVNQGDSRIAIRKIRQLLLDNLLLALTSFLSDFPGCMKSPNPFGKELPFPAVEVVFRANVPDSRMKTRSIVMIYKLLHNPSALFQRKGTLGSHTLLF